MSEPREPDDGVPDAAVDEPSGLSAAAGAMLRPVKNLIAFVTTSEPPLELQIVGRTLLHAALVGLGAGAIACLFFYGSELLQYLLLERAAGYEPLRAQGEKVIGEAGAGAFRWWLLLFIPALGALVAGLLSRWAPEIRGGGGDATIEAFHHRGGQVRRRVLLAKPLASIATLGSGGAGGREGPTMQIGGALGSMVGHYLKVGARERRVLMIAGVAAGISAVFRAPLGAALLAIEMLYRDDFESEALIPAVLASVVAYSVSISVFGQSTLFGRLPAFAFEPRHIPLYIGLALVIAAGASLFVGALHLSKRLARRLPGPAWIHPALGGLMLGVFATVMITIVGPQLGRADQGLGILGGGYGAAQVAITGADWLSTGWTGVQILLILAAAKIVAASFTIGTGGSAGDFAPSLAIGGMLGGAFGLAARLILDDPAIQPGAFALVGMGAFYGGIANTPLAALVLVCEMAGSYDLLVPLMLAEGVAFVALRRVSLYPAQLPTLQDSPVHRRSPDPLARLRCVDIMRRDRAIATVSPATTLAALSRIADGAPDQDVFPVLDGAGVLCGLVAAEALRVVASDPELGAVAIVADAMVAPASVTLGAELRRAVELLVARDLRSVPVLDDAGAIVGMIDEHDIAAVAMRGREDGA